MDKDRVKGAAKEVKGKIQKAKGDITGNDADRIKGEAKQVEGKVQKKVGQGKDAIRKATK